MRTIVAHMMIAVVVSASAWSEDACEICQGTGIQTTMTPVKITQSHTTQSATRMDSTTSEVERMEVTKTFCPKCECGKALCRESFQILNSLPGHLERQVVEEQRQVPGWKVRADTSQKQAAQANKELQDLRNSKADVRDQISKVETRIQNLGQELEKANAKQTELQEKLRNLNTQQESCKRLMDVVKRKLADYGEALPAPEKRTPPAFPLHVLRRAVCLRRRPRR
jgi:DNA repair exonuclease SbcCD ATPase subunit